MNISRISDFSSKDDLIEIKVIDLEHVNINKCDRDSVLTLIKAINKHNIRLLLYSFICLFLGLLSICCGFKINRYLFTSICIYLANSIISIFLFIEGYNFEKNIYREAENGTIVYKKAQYGILEDKYIHRTRSGFIATYYLNVKFHKNTFTNRFLSNKETYISKVSCSKETYENISEGDCVLVISFDNKEAYGVIANK